MAGLDGVSGQESKATHALGRAAGPQPARARRARDPRDDPRRSADPRQDRSRRLRRLPPPPRAEGVRLAASAFEGGMTPDEYCQQKAAASGSSFYYSFLFLPAERRRAITALYAFCREVDDVVDEASEMQIAAAKLAWWRTEIASLFAGKPQHPVTKALQPFISPFSLSKEHFGEIIDGMEMDLTQTRYLDWPGLERYCYRVAGVVGLLAASIFGYSDPRTLDYAKNLGIAFQLTNIIRDVGEDARKNRIYLPMDELKRFDVPAADILNGKHAPQFKALMRSEEHT